MTSSEDQLPRQDNRWGLFPTIVVGMLGYANSLLVSVLVATTAFSLFGDMVQKDLMFSLILLALSDSAFLLVIYLYLLPKGTVFKRLGLVRVKAQKYLYIIPAALGYVITTASLAALVSIAFPDVDLDQAQNLPFIDAQAIPEMIISGIALLVIAPIAEELVFRGFIFKGFRKSMGYVLASLLSSVLFGVAHGQLNVAIDTFALGIFLCYVYEKTGSLWSSIILHALKNGIAFYLLFFTDLAGV